MPPEKSGHFSIKIQILSACRKGGSHKMAQNVGLLGIILSPRVKPVTRWLCAQSSPNISRLIPCLSRKLQGLCDLLCQTYSALFFYKSLNFAIISIDDACQSKKITGISYFSYRDVKELFKSFFSDLLSCWNRQGER